MNANFLIANEHFKLRPVSADDDAFMREVYASTRADELTLVPWNDEQKEAFLQMQFHAQATHYQQHYPAAEYQVIERADGLPIGRLIIDRSGNSILLMDIALLPEFRNRGIGTAIIQDLMAEAIPTNRPIVLHVEIFNPAMRLYERFGFVKQSEQGVYHEMVWRNQTSE